MPQPTKACFIDDTISTNGNQGWIEGYIRRPSVLLSEEQKEYFLIDIHITQLRGRRRVQLALFLSWLPTVNAQTMLCYLRCMSHFDLTTTTYFNYAPLDCAYFIRAVLDVSINPAESEACKILHRHDFEKLGLAGNSNFSSAMHAGRKKTCNVQSISHLSFMKPKHTLILKHKYRT